MIREVAHRQFGGLWSVVINIGGTEHVLSPEADISVGREWVCACSSCRRARALCSTLEIEVRFARVEALEERRSVVRALCRAMEGYET